MSGSGSPSSESISLESDNAGLNVLSERFQDLIKIMIWHLDILFHLWQADKKKHMYKTTGWPLIWLYIILHHLMIYILNAFSWHVQREITHEGNDNFFLHSRRPPPPENKEQNITFPIAILRVRLRMVIFSKTSFASDMTYIQNGTSCWWIKAKKIQLHCQHTGATIFCTKPSFLCVALCAKDRDAPRVPLITSWDPSHYTIRSREICIENSLIALKFDRHLGSTNADVPVDFQCDAII